MVGENSRCNHGHGKDWDYMLTTGNIACVGQCYLYLDSEAMQEQILARFYTMSLEVNACISA